MFLGFTPPIGYGLFRKSYFHTVCPRSSDPFYIVYYYINWVTTSWTYSSIISLNWKNIFLIIYETLVLLLTRYLCGLKITGKKLYGGNNVQWKWPEAKMKKKIGTFLLYSYYILFTTSLNILTSWIFSPHWIFFTPLDFCMLSP